MAITVKHKFVSAIPDAGDPTIVQPSNWNDSHDLVGTVPVANGGTGAATANAGFNALAPSQTGNSGKYLTTDGTDTSWATNPLGTVTSVSGTAPVNVATGTTTPVISLSTTGSGNVVLATGATQTHPTISDYETFTSTSAPSYAEGELWYDSTQKALTYFNDVTNNQVHIGQEVQLKVINNTGSSIANGTPVYVTGTSSGQTYPNIALAQANASSTSAVLGLTNGTIASGATGYVCTAGLLTPCNTGSFSVGQVLYLSPYSAGQLMNTIPPTGYAVQVGVVAYANSPNGSIYVKQTTPLAVSASTIVGQVAVANGGTGASTLTGYVKGSGTSVMTASSTIPTTDLSGTITNAQLANSAITINGTSTSLGGSVSVGTVTSVAATAGTGISVTGSPITTSGTLSITNTAPDQTVVLTAGTGISTSGTYPNFTITNTSPSSGGTVTSVTATAPVTSTGGTTPVIAMPAATGSVNGYLTSTDWTTFNGKQAALVSGTNIKTVNSNSLLGSGDVSVGTVTSVAALTLGTTGTDLSSTVATGTTTPVITLQVPTASATNRGALSSTDWTTFNNKLTTVTVDAPLTGSGTSASHLSIPAATTSVNGYLTSTDWNTFNGKAPAVTYTTNYVPFGQGTTTPNLSSSFTYVTGTGSLTAPQVVASNGIVVNNRTIGTSFSIPSGYSASSAGPITISSGVTVTVPTGGKWVVL
jgi:hypothetical protein